MTYKVPELAIMDARGKQLNNEPLLSPLLATFIEPLVGNTSGFIIEIMGGLGIISEALSESGCDVRLMEEQRMFFVYRKQLWPKSKVTEMNMHPSAFKTNKKIFYASIIHGEEFLEFAKSISTIVFNTENFTVTYEHETPVNNTENNTSVTENKTTESGNQQES